MHPYLKFDLKFLLMCFILFLMQIIPLYSNDIYVSPKGNNHYLGSQAKPVKSIQLAKQMAIKLIASGKQEKVTIWMADGIYHIKEALEFKPIESTFLNPSVLFKAMKKANPIISGGRKVLKWTKKSNGLWEGQWPDGSLDISMCRELFINGNRATRARFPNNDFLRVKKAGEDKRTNFFFEKGDFPVSSDPTLIELILLHDWSITRIGVKEIRWRENQLIAVDTIGAKFPNFFTIDNWEEHPRYFLENSLEFIDMDYEWVFLPKTKKIVIKLPSNVNPTNENIVIPMAQGLVSILGTEENRIKNIHFDGITFQYSLWNIPTEGYCGIQATHFDPRPKTSGWKVIPAAINAIWADNIVFSNCTLRNLGGTGLNLGTGCRNSKVTNSNFYDISGNGIMLGEGQDREKNGVKWYKSNPEQIAFGNSVENCTINTCGSQFYGAVGLWAGLTSKTMIKNNEIYNLPYTGVSIGWMWSTEPTHSQENIIDGNHIHHIMNILSDGGGIYMLGLQPQSKLINNHIHDVKKNAGNAESNGIFLDEGITHVQVENNLIYNIAKSPIRFHKATQNQVRSNYLFCNDGNAPIKYNRTNEYDIEKINNLVITKGAKNYDELLNKAIQLFTSLAGLKSK